MPEPREPAATTLELFRAHAARRPDAVALEFTGGTITYGELLTRAQRRAEQLRASGAVAGSVVAVEAPLGRDHVVALLATWLVGAAAVPLDPASPAQRRQYQVRKARCDVAAVLPDADGVVTAAVATEVAGHGHPRPDPRDNLAYILFTSGSTGLPKGVQAEHPGLVNMLRYFAAVMDLGPGRRMLAHSSPVFDMSVPEMLVPLVSGGTVVLAPARTARNPEFFADLLRAAPVDGAFATPSQLRLLLPYLHSEQVFGALVSAGEALSAGLAQDLLKVTGRLFNGYGPAETTVATLCGELTPPFTDPVPIGLPLPGLSVQVLDENLQPVPDGDPGELCVSGVGVARGYVDDEALTRRSFTTGPDGQRVYRTGDVVSRHPDGRFRFHGRRDGQVKIRGHRVELGEIEVVAEREPTVSRATALLAEVVPGRPGLYLAVSARPGRTVDAAAVRRHLLAHLPAHMQPQQVLVFADLARNAAGKTDRRAVAALVQDRLAESALTPAGHPAPEPASPPARVSDNPAEDPR